MSVTTQAEVQPATTLLLPQDNDYPDMHTFEVWIETAGGSKTRREVTVADPTIDLNELFRRIANCEFGVTDITQREGQIRYDKRIVAYWDTYLDGKAEKPTSVTFSIGEEEFFTATPSHLALYDIQRTPKQ